MLHPDDQHLAFPTTRPDWPPARLIPTLFVAPWVSLNRGAHRWGWIPCLAVLACSFPMLSFFYIDNGLRSRDDIVATLVTTLILSVMQAGFITPWIRHDGKSFHAFGVALRRVWLAAPLGITLSWLGFAGFEGLDFLEAWVDERHAQSFAKGTPNDRYFNLLFQVIDVLRPVIGFGLMVFLTLVTHALAHAARPGWSSRWPGCCEQCNYALLGLPMDADCPECGRPIRDSLYTARAGGHRARPNALKRGNLAFFRPSRFGDHLTIRAPEHMPIVTYSLLLILLSAFGIYVFVVLVSPTLRSSGSSVNTFGKLLDILSLNDTITWRRNLLVYNLSDLVAMALCTAIGFCVLLSTLCFSALIAERSTGQRGFSAIRQTLYALRFHFALAVFIGELLLLWAALSSIPWLNPVLLLMSELRAWGITPPTSLTSLADTTPYAIALIYCFAVFAWFTYITSRAAKAARYANA